MTARCHQGRSPCGGRDGARFIVRRILRLLWSVGASSRSIPRAGAPTVQAGPPPPWFFLALFPIAAVSAALVIRSVAAGIARIRGARPPELGPVEAPALPAPQLAAMQAEMDEMRAELERLKAAESFYAQLQA